MYGTVWELHLPSEKANSPKPIAAAEQLQLTDNPYYHSRVAELYAGAASERAALHLHTALTLVKTKADKALILRA